MILSIESSCDDTCVAITRIKDYKLILNKKLSQEKEHSIHGGVVPELASRLHTKALPKLIEKTKPFFKELKAIAVTNEPGLGVSLIEGISCAKALSLGLKLPLIAVNHLKGHIYSLFIEKEESLPKTILLVSGGHSQILEAKSFEDIKIIASSLDDSFGESFDKCAKILGLSYPGGPIVEEYAKKGDPNSFNYPIPLKNSKQIAFSYSGLKNALRLSVENIKELKEEDKYNICASFQKTAVQHLIQKTKKYLSTKKEKTKSFAVVGGASANLYLREELKKLLKEFDINLDFAKLSYCSDNAPMIGRVAVESYKKKDFVKLNELKVNTKNTSLKSLAKDKN